MQTLCQTTAHGIFNLCSVLCVLQANDLLFLFIVRIFIRLLFLSMDCIKALHLLFLFMGYPRGIRIMACRSKVALGMVINGSLVEKKINCPLQL